MAQFRCKMCGGSLEIGEGQSIATCEYCGTRQTLPRLDDERRAQMYDRANHFRRNNEFDKAMGIYEQILGEDNTDSEAYWSIVLCRYGIEYVEDPASKRRMPTVNRAQFTSIFDDENYRSALSHCDALQRAVYEAEAKEINEIQKGILAISQKEEPFDVFICYKETDSRGQRTVDSVLAQDLYHQLTKEGLKVFFARITLEDKLGSAYEPYIFAALNSAKVMVVLGTRAEHFNATWVKNEWSRFLSLVKQSHGEKVLVPAYRDIDPYDLPEEFSHLQAQDMSKLGFMQDLVRGIRKIVGVRETVEIPTQTTPSPGYSPMVKRAFIFLDDGEFQRADDMLEQVLNQDPENATAYLGKLMVELKVRRREELEKCDLPFDKSSSYIKAFRFADDILKKELQGYITAINERNEQTGMKSKYDRAVTAMKRSATVDQFMAVAEKFEALGDFIDSKELKKKCLDLAEQKRCEEIYSSVLPMLKKETIGSYTHAIELMEQIRGYNNVDDMLYVAKAKLERMTVKFNEEANSKYFALCDRLNKTADVYELTKIRAEFFAIKDYKDSRRKIFECDDKIGKIKKAQNEHNMRFKQWIADGKCAYCGGSFTGLFTKKCSKCGKPKSY